MASFKAITPKSFTPAKSINTQMRKAVNDTLAAAQRDFQRTVRGWKTNVTFTVNKAVADGSSLRGSVGTDHKIFGYVNNGTRAHIIRPKRGKVLRFRTGYRAKTRYRTLSSGSGGYSGAVAYAQIVHHPGTRAREFDVTIADMRQPDFEKACREAIVKGISDG